MAVTLGIAALSVRAGDAPPRYDWRPGDHLVYQRRVRAVHADGGATSATQQMQLWCLRRDYDRALLLLELTNVAAGKGQSGGGLIVETDWRGVRSIRPELLERLDHVEPLLELIPQFGEAFLIEGDWLTDPDRYGRRLRATNRGADAGRQGQTRCEFTLEDATGAERVLKQNYAGTYWFSPEQRVVTRVESTRREGRAQRRTESVVTLFKKDAVSASWIRQRLEEIERYLHLVRQENRLARELVTRPKDVERLLRDMDRIWVEYASELHNAAESPIRRMIGAERRRLASRVGVLRERAALARQWLGRSAAHWSLQDFENRTLRSEDFRDRPALEFFWSTESPESLRMFAVLRALQADLPSGTLNIICMNVDSDADAARAAAAACGEGLTRVRSGPPVGGQTPRELPVFRLLSAESEVLAVGFGWHASLRSVVEPFVE